MKKILYEKITGNKFQGEFKTFDIDSLANVITTNEKINISKYRGNYNIYEKAKLQNKDITIEDIEKAPILILEKK